MSHPSGSIFSRQLTSDDGRILRYLIVPHGARGWEVREEQDDRIVRRVRYTDWQRVERARTVFDLRVSSLRGSGWIES